MNIETTDIKKLGEQALRDLYDNITNAKQFVLAQAPDICQQMIYWQISKAALWAAMLAVAIACMCQIFKRLTIRYNLGEPDPRVIAHVAGIVWVVASLVFFSIEVAQAVKAMVAPKLFVLEKIAGLIG